MKLKIDKGSTKVEGFGTALSLVEAESSFIDYVTTNNKLVAAVVNPSTQKIKTRMAAKNKLLKQLST